LRLVLGAALMSDRRQQGRQILLIDAVGRQNGVHRRPGGRRQPVLHEAQGISSPFADVVRQTLTVPDSRMRRRKAEKLIFAEAAHFTSLRDSAVYPAHLLYAVLLAEDKPR